MEKNHPRDAVRRNEVIRRGDEQGLHYGELRELQGLIHSSHVLNAGDRISVRQEQLSNEATDDQFLAVLAAAGLEEGDVEELFPTMEWDYWPDQEEALGFLELFGPNFPGQHMTKPQARGSWV